jgi:hypothetical protein
MQLVKIEQFCRCFQQESAAIYNNNSTLVQWYIHLTFSLQTLLARVELQNFI